MKRSGQKDWKKKRSDAANQARAAGAGPRADQGGVEGGRGGKVNPIKPAMHLVGPPGRSTPMHEE